jgi:hypothetical protein
MRNESRTRIQHFVLFHSTLIIGTVKNALTTPIVLVPTYLPNIIGCLYLILYRCPLYLIRHRYPLTQTGTGPGSTTWVKMNSEGTGTEPRYTRWVKMNNAGTGGTEPRSTIGMG